MHVAFMSVPAAGHVHPGLGLVQELRGRGHRVSYATTGEFADRVRAAGADPLVYRASSGYGGRVVRLLSVMEMFLDETVHALPQVADAYAAERPDVIVYDSAAHHAPILAERWQIPAVAINPTIIPLSSSDLFGSTPDPDAVAFLERYSRFLAAQGVERDLESLLFRPHRSIVTVPRSFMPDPDLYGDEFTFVGSLSTESDTDVEWSAEEDRPVLLITLGSVYNDDLEFYRQCLAAFGHTDWRVIMAVGDQLDPATLGEVPPNFEVRHWVPQASVLDRASAFVTHAGMGGTMEGLVRGVPLIAVPQAVDQLVTGPKIAELGVGCHIPREAVTVGSLRAALAEVTAPAFVARVKEMQRDILALGGASSAADVVEEEFRRAHGART
ncbi:OleI family self-immunity macrolide glycosyltransferase [Streptomyces sp. NBC_00178]|uniref:macrolide family glycosyltransferase n=1 Tax=Streptomyces sp. NBC_00178 TaxID=2975672 RepID=UPI002E2BD308|nr:macrolide family glycosyltransferase [Streptomyces sp. NBC_00178]